MFARCVLVPIVLALGSPLALAQYGYQKNETTTQPELTIARIDDQGQLVVKHIHAKPVYETQSRTITVTNYKEEQRIRQEKKIQDGEEITVQVPYTVKLPYQVEQEITVQVCKAVPVEEQITYTQNEQTKEYHTEEGGPPAVFFETNGKKVPGSQIASRLENWQPMVVTFSGQAVPDYYTYVFKPGTLVAALPRPMPKPIYHGPSGLPQPGTPMPVPQPPPGAPQDEAPKAPAANAEKTESTFSVVFQQDEEVKLPTKLPPTFAFAKIADNQITFRTITEVTQKQTVANLKAPGPAPKGEVQSFPTQIELQNVIRTHNIWQMSLSVVDASTASGQKLNSEDLPSRLPREATLLITTGGREADEFWLKGLRPETLILSTPIPDDAMFDVCQPHGHSGGHSHQAPRPPQEHPASNPAPGPPA